MNQHMRTHTHTQIHPALVHRSSKPVHCSEIRGNSSSLSKLSNLKNDSKTVRLALNVLTAKETGNMKTHSNSLFSTSFSHTHIYTHAQFHPLKIQHSLSIIEYFAEAEKGFKSNGLTDF